MTVNVDQFVAFAESGNQQRLALRDGAVLQGWIMEVNEQALLLSVGAGESGKDHWINFSDIDTESLAYWDPRRQVWHPFKPL